jgi:hypothetical protein
VETPSSNTRTIWQVKCLARISRSQNRRCLPFATDTYAGDTSRIRGGLSLVEVKTKSHFAKKWSSLTSSLLDAVAHVQ